MKLGQLLPRFVVALLIVAASGCGREAARRGTRVPITVAAVEQRTVPYEIEATGTVEPARRAEVTAQVGGLVTRIGFREGDDVRQGQVLVQLDPRPFEADAERAAAVLARDRAQAQTARLDRDRADALYEQQAVSEQERDQKRAAAAAADATVRADSAALAVARLNLANATVRAPIGGRSGDLRVNVGDLVRVNETPLVTINQVQPVLVRFTVPQSDLPALQRIGGRTITVEAADADRDSVWSEGRLVFMDNTVDPASGTVLLKGEFANRDRALWPGAFVRVRLRLYEQKDATVVPTAAITNAQGGAFTYVVKPDTTVEVRPVTVERAWRDLSVIASGLAAGETVVTDGQIRLSAGARAFIRGAAGAPAGGTAAETASHEEKR
jgi:multidrug efflux system membrane fusion protein